VEVQVLCFAPNEIAERPTNTGTDPFVVDDDSSIHGVMLDPSPSRDGAALGLI
jgi:hypothetical protein